MLRWLRCRLKWCPCYIISGTHDGIVWIGWRCADCGKIGAYEPTRFTRIWRGKNRTVIDGAAHERR